MASLTVSTKSVSQGEAPVRAARFHCCEGLGTHGVLSARAGRTQANTKTGHARN